MKKLLTLTTLFMLLAFPLSVMGADAPVNSLGELTTPAAGDEVPIVDISGTPTTKKIQVSNLTTLVYYVDSTETDQGIAGSGRSAEDLRATIGANYATVVFQHHGSAQTDYTFSTSFAFHANTTVIVKNGAILSDGGGAADLTINGPFEAGAYKVFDWTGSGKVNFTNGIIQSYPEWWKENTTPGTTDMTTAFTAAQECFPLIPSSIIGRRGEMKLQATDYVVNDWNPTDGVDIRGTSMEGTTISATTGHIIKILTTRNNSWRYCTVSDLSFMPYDSGSYAAIYTEPSGKGVANVTFRNVRFDAPGKYGCYGYFNLVTWDNCFFGNTNVTEKLISGIWLGGAGSAPHKNIIRGCTFYYMSGPAIEMLGVAGTYCQDNTITECTFEQLDSMAIKLYYAWGTKISMCYFEQLNKVVGVDADHECVVYLGTNTLGITNIDYNHFTGNSVNNTEKVISVLGGQQPYITLNWNQFGTVWNGLEMINNLSAQNRFWFLGNYYAGTPTFGSDASYYYYNNDRITNKVEQIAKPSNATIIAWQCQDTIITNLGQAGGGGATITLTLPTAAEGMLFTAVISEVPATAFYIKAGASDKIYLNGTALDDADKVGNLNAVAAIGDSIRFWTFETASGVYDWIAETVTGTWTDEGA